jgi:uncharacterized membrane protein YhiD involved in acid resistance
VVNRSQQNLQEMAAYVVSGIGFLGSGVILTASIFAA